MDRVRVAVVDNSKFRTILKPKELTLMSLFRRHVTFCKNVEACIKLVMQRDHVFLSTDYAVKFFIGSESKNRVVIRAKDNISDGRFSITLQKGSPVQNQIRNINQRLFEIGSFERILLRENYEMRPTFNQTELIPPYSVFTTRDIKGLIQLYFGGNLLAISAAVLENWLRSILKRCDSIRRQNHSFNSVLERGTSWCTSLRSLSSWALTQGASRRAALSQKPKGQQPPVQTEPFPNDWLISRTNFHPNKTESRVMLFNQSDNE